MKGSVLEMFQDSILIKPPSDVSCSPMAVAAVIQIIL